MKKLLIIIAVVCLSVSAFAQTGLTNVTASHLENDLSGSLLTGKVCLTPMLNGHTTGFTANGGAQVLPNRVCYPVTAGGLNINVPDTSLAQPSGIAYHVDFLSTNGLPVYSWAQPVPVAGTTFSLDSYAPAQVANVTVPTIQYLSSAPSGNCGTAPAIAYVGTTIYTCESQAWQAISGGGSQADWNASSGSSQILNKPTLATVATTGSYNDLTNKPSTTAPGQYIYAQSGDTIASIETACSSLCTYVVTIPQTITLSASHTLSSNVNLQFQQDGKWTVNGAFTLTVPGNITGTLSPHFAGTSTISFGVLQQSAPVEWFGAVGDGVTDDHVAIQATLNALLSGQAVLQARTYSVGSSTLSVTKSNVGIAGNRLLVTNTTLFPTPASSVILSTSTTADILDVAGVSVSNNVVNNVFNDFTVARSAAPTGTTDNGISFSFTYATVVSNVFSEDSHRGFYLHSFGSLGVGIIDNSGAQWGYNGFVETSGNFYGFYVDSSDGDQSPSVRSRNCFVASNLGATPVTYGWYDTGTALNDRMVWNFETASVSYGEYLNATGSASGFAHSDIHFWGAINDSPKIAGIYVAGISSGAHGSVEFAGGETTSVTNTGTAVDIESSVGVTISNHQIWSAFTKGVYINGGGNNTVVNDNFPTISGPAVALNSTKQNTVNSNTATGSGAANCILGTSASQNTILGNTCNTFTNGVNLDSNSNSNAGIFQNAFFGVANGVVNSGNNPLIVQGTGGETGPSAPLWVYNTCTNGCNEELIQNPSPTGAVTLTVANDTGSIGGMYAGGSANPNAAYRNSFYFYNAVGDFNIRANASVHLDGGTNGTPTTHGIAVDTSNNASAGVSFSSPTYYGPATAPTGSCTSNGAWVFSQDGHATFCSSGTWVSKI